MNQKITPHLWFDSEAEEAANFYVSVFSGFDYPAKVLDVARYPKSAEAVSGKSAGSVMTATFELNGQKFVALNGGPIFKFNESISFIVECADQKEIDYFWGELSAVPESEQCGWLKDKFGLSWQIVPKGMGEFFKQDPAKVEKGMATFLKMKKIDIAELQKTAEG